VGIPRRLRKVKFTTSASQITSFASLPLLFSLAIRLGLVRDLQSLTVKKRRRGIPIEDFVLSLAANFVVGGDNLSDLDVLRQEEVTRRLCRDLQVPAQEAVFSNRSLVDGLSEEGSLQDGGGGEEGSSSSTPSRRPATAVRFFGGGEGTGSCDV
jgi:hypothetical protein